MTPPGMTLRNLRVADECTWAGIFEKCKTKELRRPHQRTTLLGNLGGAPQWCPARTAGIRRHLLVDVPWPTAASMVSGQNGRNQIQPARYPQGHHRASMVSGQEVLDQAVARWHRLDQHPASMVSGQNGRNQKAVMRLSRPGNHMPQWCPARTAGIRRGWSIHPSISQGCLNGVRPRRPDQAEEIAVIIPVHDPQWCPAGTAGIRQLRRLGQHTRRLASMVSGQNGRNQRDSVRACPGLLVASMVSGQESRNQKASIVSETMAVLPQWCPARTAGISRPNAAPSSYTHSGPQWCPARTAGIRTASASGFTGCSRLNGVRPERPESVVELLDQRVLGVASMVSGQNGRNQSLRPERHRSPRLASMVSGQNGRNQQNQPAGQPISHSEPQWCPTKTAGISTATPSCTCASSARLNGVQPERPESVSDKPA